MEGNTSEGVGDWWSQALNHADIDVFDLNSLDDHTSDHKTDIKSIGDLKTPSQVTQLETNDHLSNLTDSNPSKGTEDQLSSIPQNTTDIHDPCVRGTDVDVNSDPEKDETACQQESSSTNEADNTGSCKQGLDRVNDREENDSVSCEQEPTEDSNKEDDDSDLDDFLLKLPVPPTTIPSFDDDDDDDDDGNDEDISVDDDECKGEDDKEKSSEQVKLDSREEMEVLNKLLDSQASLSLEIEEPLTPARSDCPSDVSDPQSPWSVKFPPLPPQAPHLDHTHPDAYIEQASRLITKAIELESSKEYHDAFDLFKAGVDLLLNGVKVDTDRHRRDVVRKKLEGYLKHAEELHEKYLSTPEGNSVVQLQVPQPHKMKDFKVCRVEGKVIIVESILSARKFAIKSLYRVPSNVSRGKNKLVKVKNLSQDCIPYMVKLYQHFEGHSGCVFLMLEYIKGGRLVDFIQANRHHWGYPVPPSHEPSPQPPPREESLTLNPQKSVDLETQISGTSSAESEHFPTPPLVVNPPTPLVSPIDANRSLPDIEQSTPESVPNKLIQVAEGGSEIHFSPTPHSGSRQGSPATSLRTPKTSILERKIKSWSAQIIIALESLHSHGVMCGDLNSSNILITPDGEARLTYFGRWQGIMKRSDPYLLENHFIAPELHVHHVPTPSSDFWSLGIILFELLCGKSFLSCHPGGLHTHLPLSIPNRECLSPEAQSLLAQLIQVNSRERLGAGLAGIEEVKSHSFFSGVDWESLLSRDLPTNKV